MDKNVVKKRYVVTHGVDWTVYRFISAFFRNYGIDKQYDQKKIRKKINENGFWINKTGEIMIRKTQEID